MSYPLSTNLTVSVRSSRIESQLGKECEVMITCQVRHHEAESSNNRDSALRCFLNTKKLDLNLLPAAVVSIRLDLLAIQ